MQGKAGLSRSSVLIFNDPQLLCPSFSLCLRVLRRCETVSDRSDDASEDNEILARARIKGVLRNANLAETCTFRLLRFLAQNLALCAIRLFGTVFSCPPSFPLFLSSCGMGWPEQGSMHSKAEQGLSSRSNHFVPLVHIYAGSRKTCLWPPLELRSIKPLCRQGFPWLPALNCREPAGVFAMA